MQCVSKFDLILCLHLTYIFVLCYLITFVTFITFHSGLFSLTSYGGMLCSRLNKIKYFINSGDYVCMRMLETPY